MYKIYLIIYKPENDSDILKDRIKGLGSHYKVFDSHWFVKSVLDTAKEVYDAIVKDDLTTINLLVLNIIPTVQDSYWGYMNASLWDWLKEQ